MRTIKLVLLLLLIASFAGSSVVTLATINGTGVAVALSTNANIRANWIQVVTDGKTLNTSNVMFRRFYDVFNARHPDCARLRLLNANVRELRLSTRDTLHLSWLRAMWLMWRGAISRASETRLLKRDREFRSR